MAQQLVKRVANSAVMQLRKAAPKVQEAALGYIQKATLGKVTNLDASASYAGQNKGTVAIVTRAAVQAGVNPNQIFTQDVLRGMQDADLLKLRDSMIADFNKLYGPIDAKSAFQDGDTSRSNRERILAGAMETVRGFLGGPDMSDKRLRDIHVCLKLFLEMSEGEVADLLATKASFRVNGAI